MWMLMLTIEFDKAKASSSNSTSTPKINRHKIFAPASPAFSGKAAALSSSGRRPSLRASDTGMDVVSMCYPFFFFNLNPFYSPCLRWEEASAQCFKWASQDSWITSSLSRWNSWIHPCSYGIHSVFVLTHFRCSQRPSHREPPHPIWCRVAGAFHWVQHLWSIWGRSGGNVVLFSCLFSFPSSYA